MNMMFIRYEYAEESNSSQQSAFIDPPLFYQEEQQPQQYHHQHHFLDSCDDPAMPFPSTLMMLQEDEDAAAAATISNNANHHHHQHMQYSPLFNQFPHNQHQQEQQQQPPPPPHFMNASSSNINNVNGYWQPREEDEQQHQQRLLLQQQQQQQLHHGFHQQQHHPSRNMQSINKTSELAVYSPQYYHYNDKRQQQQQHNTFYVEDAIDDEENMALAVNNADIDFGKNNFAHFHKSQRQQHDGYPQQRQKQPREPFQRLHHLEEGEFFTDSRVVASSHKNQQNKHKPNRQYKIESPECCCYDDDKENRVDAEEQMNKQNDDENKKILCGPPAHWRLDELDEPQNSATLKHKGGRQQQKQRRCDLRDFALIDGGGTDYADDEFGTDEVNPKVPHVAPNGFVKPAYSYSCLIGLSLKNSATGELTVSEIYTFLCHHFPYFREAPSGWKNSVRHNLSLNKCFKKIEVEIPGCHGRKSCLWTMNPVRRAKMDQELKKSRNRDEPGIRIAMERPDDLDLLQNGQIGMPPNMKPRRFSIPATHDDSTILTAQQQQKHHQQQQRSQRRLAVSGPSQIVSQHDSQQPYRSPIHKQQQHQVVQQRSSSMRLMHRQQRQQLEEQMTPSRERANQYSQTAKQSPQTSSSENLQQHEKVPRAESVHALAARRKLENLLQRQKTSSTSAEIDTPIDPCSGMLVPSSDGRNSGAKKRRSSENASECSTSGHSSRRHSRHSNEHNNSNNNLHQLQQQSGMEQPGWQNSPEVQQQQQQIRSDTVPAIAQSPFQQHFQKHAAILYDQLSGSSSNSYNNHKLNDCSGSEMVTIDNCEMRGGYAQQQNQYHQHQLLLQQHGQRYNHHYQQPQQHAPQQDLSICVEQQFMQQQSAQPPSFPSSFGCSTQLENLAAPSGFLKSMLSNPVGPPFQSSLPSPFTTAAVGTNLGLDSCENALLLDNPLLLDLERTKESPT